MSTHTLLSSAAGAFSGTSTPLSDVRFPIDMGRPLTALKNHLQATGSSAEPQVRKIVDDRPRRRNNLGDPQVPVIASPASSTRLARISDTTEAIRSETAFRSPYFSRAWMCPSQRWPVPLRQLHNRPPEFLCPDVTTIRAASRRGFSPAADNGYAPGPVNIPQSTGRPQDGTSTSPIVGRGGRDKMSFIIHSQADLPISRKPYNTGVRSSYRSRFGGQDPRTDAGEEPGSGRVGGRQERRRHCQGHGSLEKHPLLAPVADRPEKVHLPAGGPGAASAVDRRVRVTAAMPASSLELISRRKE